MYYVCAFNDEPNHISFSYEEAIETFPDFIDVFDEDGNKQGVYEFDGEMYQYTEYSK